MCDEISARSFGVAEGGAATSIGEYAAYCQPVDAIMDGFHVGGVAKEVASFTAVKINAPHEDTPPAPPPPPVSDDCTESSVGDCIYPAADMTQFENQIFADIIAKRQHAVLRDEIHLQHAWMIDDDGDDGALLDGDDSESDGSEAYETGECAQRSGDATPRHQPVTGEVIGGASGTTPPPVGGVSIRPYVIPPRRVRRHQMRQGFFWPVPLFPPPPGLDHAPPSPDYSPGSSGDEAEASIDTFDIGNSSISSTNDVAAEPRSLYLGEP
ncbi:hypothetical protein CYMTET_22077 [Cymbomonas tetramitiformis]|uniref:Uncharacterized protein n=1 Tax=Cymbomonas tetramitiformis TaxID=36881 RepID=A0AAE0G0P0_9CHLO|nr:hypothetical protein CYMTET_22077 [Cymbomonas tetramitiformis]